MYGQVSRRGIAGWLPVGVVVYEVIVSNRAGSALWGGRCRGLVHWFSVAFEACNWPGE